MRRLAVLLFAALVMASTACKFSEIVAAPPGEPTVIVQMVLNTEAPVQRLVLERSSGGTSKSFVFGATVRLTHLNPDASCAQPTVTLVEVRDSIIYGGTRQDRFMYQTSDLCTLHAGDQVGLRVETPQGAVVTGTTQVPGANRLLVKAGPVTALAPQTLVLDRTRDTIRVELDPRFARGLQIEAMRKGGNPRVGQEFRGELTPAFGITTDTLHATIAVGLQDPFEDEDQRTVFHAGVDYLFSFAPTDNNYFDFVRSGANPFTGRGFINYLSGGIGVFGSVAPQTYEVRVTAPQKDPREGVYRIFGGAKGVDLTFDLYLDPASDEDEFSALTDGRWIEGPVRSSARGDFQGGFYALFYGLPADPLATVHPLYEIDYNASTLPRRGTPFTATLKTTVRGKTTTFDQVSVVQVSGP